MKLYLACTESRQLMEKIEGSDILSAFPYIRKDKGMIDLIPKMRNFMLDSGVFTMINSHKRFNLESYIDEYADFILEHKIRNYIEMDVDQIIGVKETRRIRERLEAKVGYQSIPVWHTIRGKESFIQDCKDYNYICLGFFLTEGLKTEVTDKYAKAFIDKAHELDCRIHGLGYTKIENLKKLGFDSVDSSTWTAAKRFAVNFQFDPKTCMMKYGKKSTKRLKCSTVLNMPAFVEWKKMQDYAYKNIEPIWQ